MRADVGNGFGGVSVTDNDKVMYNAMNTKSIFNGGVQNYTKLCATFAQDQLRGKKYVEVYVTITKPSSYCTEFI